MPPCFSTLSRARARNCSRVQPDRATPMTGTSSRPWAHIACRAGKIFLQARSPVAPRKTRASDTAADMTDSPVGRISNPSFFWTDWKSVPRSSSRSAGDVVVVVPQPEDGFLRSVLVAEHTEGGGAQVEAASQGGVQAQPAGGQDAQDVAAGED